MERKDLNQLNMQETVSTLFSENQEIIKIFPFLENNTQVLSNINSDIRKLSILQDQTTKATDYQKGTPSINEINAQIKEATAEIKLKLIEAKTLLKEKLDPMMLPFQNLNPTFYGQYLRFAEEQKRIILS